jgi:hypothetical protein
MPNVFNLNGRVAGFYPEQQAKNSWNSPKLKTKQTKPLLAMYHSSAIYLWYRANKASIQIHQSISHIKNLLSCILLPFKW